MIAVLNTDIRLKRKPETDGEDGPLEMNLQVLGDLHVTGLEAGRVGRFWKEGGRRALPRDSDLKVVDARGEELEARFEGMVVRTSSE
jgi:hypothetical protein